MLLEGDPVLLNVISVLTVNPSKVLSVHAEEAQGLIAEFEVERYGQPLFYPRAPGWSTTLRPLVGRSTAAP